VLCEYVLLLIRRLIHHGLSPRLPCAYDITATEGTGARDAGTHRFLVVERLRVKITAAGPFAATSVTFVKDPSRC
jgi:hypothetical protein